MCLTLLRHILGMLCIRLSTYCGLQGSQNCKSDAFVASQVRFPAKRRAGHSQSSLLSHEVKL